MLLFLALELTSGIVLGLLDGDGDIDDGRHQLHGEQRTGVTERSHLRVGKSSEETGQIVYQVAVVDEAVLTLFDHLLHEVGQVTTELLIHGSRHDQGVLRRLLQQENTYILAREDKSHIQILCFTDLTPKVFTVYVKINAIFKKHFSHLNIAVTFQKV